MDSTQRPGSAVSLVQGPRGFSGPQGPKGDDGPTGPPGEPADLDLVVSPETGKLHEQLLPDSVVSRDALPINVRTFGAIGNGVADDTAAIRAAIAAIPATGGRVFLPAGVYVISGTLNMPTDRPWSLAGAGVRSTQIKLAATANVDMLAYAGSTPGSYVPSNFDYLCIQDIEFHGNKAAQSAAVRGIVLTGADYFVLDRIAVTLTRGSGISITSSDEGTICNSFVTSCGGTISSDAGIKLNDGAHDVIIVGCGFESNTGAAVFLNQAYESQVVGCNFWQNSYDVRGTAAGCNSNVIANCVLEAATTHSISFDAAATRCIIIGNRVMSSVGDGVRLDGVSHFLVQGNLISGSTATGINERNGANNNQLVNNKLVSNGTALATVGAATVALLNAGAAGPAVTGSRGGNAALASLLTALNAAGIVSDGTSA